MKMEDRTKRAELETTIKAAMTGNPVLAGAMAAWIKLELAETVALYDNALTYDEVCRIKGVRCALEDMYRIVSARQ